MKYRSRHNEYALNEVYSFGTVRYSFSFELLRWKTSGKCITILIRSQNLSQTLTTYYSREVLGQSGKIQTITKEANG